VSQGNILENIFFVENILKTKGGDNCTVILFNASSFREKERPENSDYFTVHTIPVQQLNDVTEGSFYFYNPDTHLFQRANNTPIARYFIFINNIFRRRLIDKTITENKDESNTSKEFVSYHVNVGHGNCSFVVEINTKNIWLVDCSNGDWCHKGKYQTNIDACVTYIQERFHIKQFHILKVFITHPHFDHYSGVDTLIDKGFIDSKTIFYINSYYNFANGLWNNLLNRIAGLTTSRNIIEPIIHSKFDGVDILYPKQSVVRTSATTGGPYGRIIQPNANNASVVLKITDTNNKSFLFTGDIETAAWNTVDTCYPHLGNCDYYAISHHGSDTGHDRTVCPMKCSISNVTNCLKDNVRPVLMGQDKAYPGIYSPKVKSDFKNIIYTENAEHFVEIEWRTNTIKPY